MHDQIASFEYDSRLRIVDIRKIEHDTENNEIKAYLTTIHHKRVTTKWFRFTLQEWAKIAERGYIE